MEPKSHIHRKLHIISLGCSLFARRYWGNILVGYRSCRTVFYSYDTTSSLFLFHWLLRCFTSPGALHTPMYSADDRAAFPARGFPIRISPDQRLLATSPKLFAGCYVLLRRFMSSHPPYALIALQPSENRNAVRFQQMVLLACLHLNVDSHYLFLLDCIQL